MRVKFVHWYPFPGEVESELEPEPERVGVAWLELGCHRALCSYVHARTQPPRTHTNRDKQQGCLCARARTRPPPSARTAEVQQGCHNRG